MNEERMPVLIGCGQVTDKRPPEEGATAIELMVDVARLLQERPFPQQLLIFDPRKSLINEVIRFLYDNLNGRLQLRDIAAQFHLSERHINRLFKKATGQDEVSAHHLQHSKFMIYE